MLRAKAADVTRGADHAVQALTGVHLAPRATEKQGSVVEKHLVLDCFLCVFVFTSSLLPSALLPSASPHGGPQSILQSFDAQKLLQASLELCIQVQSACSGTMLKWSACSAQNYQGSMFTKACRGQFLPVLVTSSTSKFPLEPAEACGSLLESHSGCTVASK